MKNKKLKYSHELSVDDEIGIGGLLCKVVKVETVFYQIPNNRIRLSLKVIGATPKIEKIVLFLPLGLPIKLK